MGAELCRKALKEGSQALRIQALKCLPEVGGPAEAEKAGLELCRDRNRDVRAAAVWALHGSSAEEVLEEILVVLVNEQDPNVQRNAVHALIHLPNQNTTRRLLDLLQKRLAGGEPPAEKGKKRSKTQTTTDGDAEQIQTTSLVIEALGSRRDKERAAVARALLPLARGKQPALRQAALAALSGVGTVNKEVVPTLAEAAADKNCAIAEAAVGALERLTPRQREPALPALLNILAKSKEKDPSVRCRILKLLPYHIDNHRKEILAAMGDALKNKDRHIADVLSSALQCLGPAAQPLLPDLMDACRMGNRFHFYSNRSLMGAIDPDGVKAIPLLVKLLSDKLPLARYAALELLYSYGRKANRALPHIEKLRDDKDTYVRQAAERALAVIRA
jgi:HEAT repeat protein